MHTQLIVEHTPENPKSNIVLASSSTHCKQIEQFAWRCFNKAYDADLKDFLPHMLALVDQQHAINASAGFQSARNNPLYLEQYLSVPIEQAIQQQLQLVGTPRREQILEVGNLASTSPGATRRLILSLAQHFQQRGFKWLAITATPKVRCSFDKLNLELHHLAQAFPEALTHSATDWGRYYTHQPNVYVGDIESGIATLSQSPLFKRMIERSPAPISDQFLHIKG